MGIAFNGDLHLPGQDVDVMLLTGDRWSGIGDQLFRTQLSLDQFNGELAI